MKFSIFFLIIFFQTIQKFLSSPNSNFKPQFFSDFSKETLSFQLPNHLKVLIISDKSLNKNGIALQVDIGSSHEPLKFSGIAHLLEHMLHMKSHKYPTEGFFKQNLALFQGVNNAMTNDITTTYYFWINDKRLESFQTVASIFSRFFIDPIMDKDGVEREINAVHNEYENALVEDQWRFHELLRNLANKKSLFNHFSIGNKQRLNTSSHDITKELNEFFNKYYSSHIMHLVIYGNHPLNELREIANIFNEIPYKSLWNEPINLNNKFLDKNQTKSSEKFKAFPKKLKGKFVFYNPVGDLNSLSIVFPLENYLAHMNKKTVKPIEFLSNLIRFKGKNSLYNKLKQKKLITSFSVGNLDKFINLNLFLVRFDVSDKGFKNKIEILRIFFAFLRELRKKGTNFKNYKEMAYRKYVQNLFNKKRDFREELLNYLSIFKQNGGYNAFIEKNSKNFLKFDRILIQKYAKYFSDPMNSLIIFSEKYKEKEKLQLISRFTGRFSHSKTMSENFEENKAFRNNVFNINDLFEQKDVNFNYDNQFQENEKSVDLLGDYRFKDQRDLNKKWGFYDEIMKFEFGSKPIPLNYIKSFTKANFFLNSSKFYIENTFYPKKFRIASLCTFLTFPQYQKAYGNKLNLQKIHIEFDIKNIFETFFLKKSTKNFLISRKNRIFNKTCYYNEKIPDMNYSRKDPIYKTNGLTVFSVTDRILDIPKVSAIFEIKIPFPSKSAFLLIFLRLFEETNEEVLNEIREIWGNIEFTIDDFNIKVNFFGFSDKFEEILTRVFSLLKNTKFGEKDFKRNKQFILNVLELKKNQRVLNHLLQYVKKLFNKDVLLDYELNEQLVAMNFQNFQDFHKVFINKSKIKALFLGNILKAEVLKLSKKISKILFEKTYLEKNTNLKKIQLKKNSKKLEKSEKNSDLNKKFTYLSYAEVSKNMDDKNSGIVNLYLKGNYTARDYKRLKSLINIFNTKSFDYLRTKKQLGYIVLSLMFANHKFAGIGVYIQGSRNNPKQMDQEIENFITNFRDFIRNKSNRGQFEKKIQKKNRKKTKNTIIDYDLEDRAESIWKGLDFKPKNQRAKKQKKVTYEEIVEFYDELFFQSRQKITIQISSFRQKNSYNMLKSFVLNKNSHTICRTIPEMASYVN